MSTQMIVQPKEAGVVTHFYGKIGVATVHCEDDIELGRVVRFKGAHTDFKEPITSMEYEHQAVVRAKKGQDVGIRVDARVREGDRMLVEA